MRLLLLPFILFSFFLRSQTLHIPKNSLLHDLKENDSLFIYQGHVEEASGNLVTASGQTVVGKQQQVTITEKFVIRKTGEFFTYQYFQSGLSIFPNKKFSGLKIREKSYWGFHPVASGSLTEKDLLILLKLEEKGREAIEYDFPLSRYTRNQIILKKGKDFKQLVIEGNYVISRLAFKG